MSCIQKSFVFSSYKLPTIQLFLDSPGFNYTSPRSHGQGGQITHWSAKCFTQCLQILEPLLIEAATVKMDPLHSTDIPSDYADLAEEFSKAKATQLPPHRSSDCAIEIPPGTTPPKSRIFPLLQPETESMRTYIEEELAKGFIVPSKSPASAGFFFVKKREGLFSLVLIIEG